MRHWRDGLHLSRRCWPVRERLERNRGSFPLFDTSRYRRHIEAASEP